MIVNIFYEPEGLTDENEVQILLHFESVLVRGLLIGCEGSFETTCSDFCDPKAFPTHSFGQIRHRSHHSNGPQQCKRGCNNAVCKQVRLLNQVILQQSIPFKEIFLKIVGNRIIRNTLLKHQAKGQNSRYQDHIVHFICSSA